MSKIGTYNLAITEKVNELGYETVEDAIADGWDSSEFYASYIKDEQEQAHKEWLEEKKMLVGDLRNLLIGMHAQGRSDGTDYTIVKHALEFIIKGE